MENRFRGQALIYLLLGCIFVVLSACGSGQAKTADIRVSGARDVMPLIRAVQDGFFAQSGYTLAEAPSKQRIKDLRDAKLDLVVLGREPKSEELSGLKDTVVAYDGVVMVVSTRTYYGGEYRISQGTSQNVLKDKRFDGLKELKMSDLQGLYKNRLNLHGLTEYWFPDVPLYQFKPAKGLDGGLILDETKSPPEWKGSWVPSPTNMIGYLYPPQEYDLQTAMLDKLGIVDPNPQDRNRAYMPAHLESEEELLSFAFKIDPTLATPVSYSVAFDLYLLPFSRHTFVRALEHGFSIQPLKIEGIEPLSSPKAIYDGSYPLSRRIHILTLETASEPTKALLKYLLSASGQDQIAKAEFLPLPAR